MSLLLQVKLLLNLNLNYNKILKCTNIKFKITISIIINILFILLYLYKNTTHDICHHIYMYDEWDKNTNSQTNNSTRYISNTYGGVMQNKIYCN